MNQPLAQRALPSQRPSSIPPPRPDDLDMVECALTVATSAWSRGDSHEALRWLQKAARSAAENDADRRALELSKAAADLTTELDAEKQRRSSAPPPPRRPRPKQPSGRHARPVRSTMRPPRSATPRPVPATPRVTAVTRIANPPPAPRRAVQSDESAPQGRPTASSVRPAVRLRSEPPRPAQARPRSEPPRLAQPRAAQPRARPGTVVERAPQPRPPTPRAARPGTIVERAARPARAAQPRSAQPRAAQTRSSAPPARAAQPRAAQPRSAQPRPVQTRSSAPPARAAQPRAAQPRAAHSSAVRHAVRPQEPAPAPVDADALPPMHEYDELDEITGVMQRPAQLAPLQTRRPAFTPPPGEVIVDSVAPPPVPHQAAPVGRTAPVPEQREPMPSEPLTLRQSSPPATPSAPEAEAAPQTRHSLLPPAPEAAPARHSSLPPKPEPYRAHHSSLPPKPEPYRAHHSSLPPEEPEPYRAHHSSLPPAPEPEPYRARHSSLPPAPEPAPRGRVLRTSPPPRRPHPTNIELDEHVLDSITTRQPAVDLRRSTAATVAAPTRIALLQRADGSVSLMLLSEGEGAPEGAATAFLVAASEADAHTLSALLGSC